MKLQARTPAMAECITEKNNKMDINLKTRNGCKG
jgi:hypothetical protein